MDKIVKYKRPASVVYGPIVAPLGEPGIITGRSRQECLANVRKHVKAGNIRDADGPSLRYEDGHWLINVRLMPAAAHELRPRPWWVRALKVGVPVLLLLSLAGWVLVTFSAFIFKALLLAALVALLALLRGGRSVTIFQSNNVDVR